MPHSRHSSTISSVPCDQIKISGRHRQDMGDLQGLAESILKEGLLQPIGITEQNEMVFGERRLRAVQDVLEWPTIEARVIRVSSILAGEFAENEVRKDFTSGERVAIGEAIEAELGSRQGQRTDVELRENIPEVGARTTEIAAEKAGFGNRKTYEQAKKVVQSAEPEVAAAMDSGDLSISAAAVVADEPPEEQKRIVEMPKPEQRRAVKKVRQKRMTEAQARKIAIVTGKHTSDGKNYIPPVTKYQEQQDARLEYLARRLIDGIERMADPGIATPEMIQFMCRRRVPIGGISFNSNLQKAVGWMDEFHREWTAYAKDNQQTA